MHYRFKGNPATNAAGRYSLALQRYRQALRHWQRNGHIGPRPVAPTPPPSLDDGQAPETQAERNRREQAERAARKAEIERAQHKLF